jgi:hypothetical protein
MTKAIQEITAEELLRMPDHSFRYELVRGELRKAALAGSLHGIIAMQVTVTSGSMSRQTIRARCWGRNGIQARKQSRYGACTGRGLCQEGPDPAIRHTRGLLARRS